jgi:hypothetical protein
MRPGKAPVSCVPCAKRKVRCDKQRPCCHCKRRPQDRCVYPVTASDLATAEAPSLAQRISELERQIRDLGGSPKGTSQSDTETCRASNEVSSGPGSGEETGLENGYSMGLKTTGNQDTYIEAFVYNHSYCAGHGFPLLDAADR